jgi:zinc transporter ZupT
MCAKSHLSDGSRLTKAPSQMRIQGNAMHAEMKAVAMLIMVAITLVSSPIGVWIGTRILRRQQRSWTNARIFLVAAGLLCVTAYEAWFVYYGPLAELIDRS